jgi:ATP-dependent RNA helicase RhlE
VDILIATPGRLLDHVQQRTVDLSQVEVFVLDEADRMLDMGFIHDIRKVIRLLPNHRQNLMFSATYSDDIRKLAQGLLRDPAEVEVARRNTAVESVTQIAHCVPKEGKRALLSHLIRSNEWQQVLVFTRTKHGANRLVTQLNDDSISAAAIHGNKSQNARTAALDGFKSGKVRALVATEVAARGLDIKELPFVVNYELPNVPEDYVHRIGRTGRAGATGTAVSLVAPDEMVLLRDIERVIAKQVARQPLPEISAPPARAHAPAREPRDDGGARDAGGAYGARPQHAPSRPFQSQPRRGNARPAYATSGAQGANSQGNQGRGPSSHQGAPRGNQRGGTR